MDGHSFLSGCLREQLPRYRHLHSTMRPFQSTTDLWHIKHSSPLPTPASCVDPLWDPAQLVIGVFQMAYAGVLPSEMAAQIG
ncbi:hypothetical protein [Alicyclobacillus fodiniaquatilis]|uniref:Uncharacterized protein n=1 Tax=Alicyclobacillus fodiniaquatilis TaxID=1661150 RepID=A0ABW4JPS9_9BACL